MGINKAYLEGNLGQDPKVFADGKVVSLSVAHTHMKWNGKDVPKTKVTHWQTVKIFGYEALKASHFKKGDSVFVEGMLQTNEWDDKETGKKRSTVELLGDSIRRIVKEERNETSPRPSMAADDIDSSSIPF